MTIYLHDIPLPEALARLEAALRQAGLWGLLGQESIPLDEQAVGRDAGGRGQRLSPSGSPQKKSVA